MRIMRVSLILSFVVTLCLCCTSSAQQASRIEAMKLLTPNTGWAATNKKLFWTTDGGTQWKDITPKLDHKEQRISSVIFLDSSSGWALLNCGDGRDPKVDDVCFEFASTTDAGRNWMVVHPKIVDPVLNSSDIEDGLGFSGRTYLDFADSQHGWAILKKSHNVTASFGVTLRTLDGGHTWTQLTKGGMPIADHFLFVTAKDGWIAGQGQSESDLYVTHDAGNTWNQVVVKPPPAIKVETWPPVEDGVWPDYELPIFETPERGFLIGSYWDGQNPDPTPVLFSTTDLGQNWNFERVLSNLNGTVIILHETLITASVSQGMDKLTLTRLPLGNKAAQAAAVTADVHSIPIKHYNWGAGYDALNMIDDDRGWLLADELLATADGGMTWTDITPGGSPLRRVP